MTRSQYLNFFFSLFFISSWNNHRVTRTVLRFIAFPDYHSSTVGTRSRFVDSEHSFRNHYGVATREISRFSQFVCRNDFLVRGVATNGYSS